MAQQTFTGLFSFYWIDQCGLTRFRWYANTEEAEIRQEKDDLLAGFLSAIMNFSREMFKGEELAHIELYNYRIFFRTLPRKDIFALVTTMNYEEARAGIILSHVINHLTKIDIPEMSCKVGESDWVLPILLAGIDNAQPKSMVAFLEPYLQNVCTQRNCIGYLIKEYNGSEAVKKLNDCADFELSTFLESVFWEKIAAVMHEQTSSAEKVFNLGPVKWVLMNIGIGTLSNFYHQKGFFSVAYSTGASDTEIRAYANDIKTKLEKLI